MKRLLFHLIVLSVLGYGLFLSASYALKAGSRAASDEPIRYALVEGNVQNPGYYQVDSFSTNLTVLEKAGLNDSSKITNINLMDAADPSKSLQVGVSQVKVKAKTITTFNDLRLEFTLGDVVHKREENVRKPINGVALKESDVLLFRQNGSGKISFKNMSEIDAAPETKLVLKKVDTESSPAITVLQLDQGKIRLRIPSETPGATLVIFTPEYRIDFSEGLADLTIQIKQFDTQVHVGKGIVKVTRISDDVSVQIGKNQLLTAKMGDQYLEPVEKLFSKQVAEGSFAKLEKEWNSFKKNQEEVSVLLTSGTHNLLVSLIPDKNKMILMDIPPNTYVGDYIDGVFRLDHALGIAGSEIMREVVQRILGRQIKYVARIDFKNISDFAYVIDGIGVEVDGVAALDLRVSPGYRVLQRQQILRYLNPHLGGGEKMAMLRQKRVMRAFMEKMAEGGLQTYSHVVVTVVRDLEGNIDVDEGINLFKVYAQKDHWNAMEASMPGTTFQVGPMVLIKPDYDAIQSFF